MSTNEEAYLKFYIAVEVAHAAYSMELSDELRERDCNQWQKICWLLERRYPKEFGRFGITLTQLYNPESDVDEIPILPDPPQENDRSDMRNRIRAAHNLPEAW